MCVFCFFSSRRRHTRYIGDWSSDVCSSDLSDGQKCIYSNCIGYFSASEYTMEVHCRTHGWKKNDPIIWKKCAVQTDRKSTRLNSSHRCISYAVFCLKKKKKKSKEIVKMNIT